MKILVILCIYLFAVTSHALDINSGLYACRGNDNSHSYMVVNKKINQNGEFIQLGIDSPELYINHDGNTGWKNEIYYTTTQRNSQNLYVEAEDVLKDIEIAFSLLVENGDRFVIYDHLQSRSVLSCKK